jgi:hypothetical protein
VTTTRVIDESTPEVTDAIRQVCEQANQGAEIWDVLDAKGIETTPGIVHQAIADLTEPDNSHLEKGSSARLLLDSSTGLTTEDIECLAALADKLGGVDALIAALRAMKSVRKKR